LRQTLSGELESSYNEVLKHWKDLSYVAEDVVQVVVEAYREKKMSEVGAPFEADHQRGVADYILTTG
jgi:hypothetical protein